MKKTHIIAAILCILAVSACSKENATAENFEDPVFRAYLLSTFDTNEDGKFSKAEREAVVAIDVTNLGIRSLKGIEAFPSLQILKCSNNELTELDVYNNKQLTYLDCSYNKISPFINTPNNSKLKYLDYSNNSEIGVYSPNGEKELEYLDLSNSGYSDGSFRLPKLKYLKCSGCRMHAIFITLCMELIYLDISNNEFSDLNPPDLTHNINLNTLIATDNPELKEIYLKEGVKIQDLRIDKQVEIVYK